MSLKSYTPKYFNKPSTKEYGENYDRIFGKKAKVNNGVRTATKDTKIHSSNTSSDHSSTSVVKRSTKPSPSALKNSPVEMEQQKVNSTVVTEQKIAEAVKEKLADTTIPFHKQDPTQQFKTLFNNFPVDEVGGVVGKDRGVADAVMPKSEK